MSNPVKPTLFNTTVFNTLGKIVFYLFIFFTSYFTSRSLSKAAFGEIQYIMLIINLSWLFLNLGFPNVLGRNFAQAFLNQHVKGLYKLIRYAVLAMGITLGMSIGVLLFLFLNNLAVTNMGIIIILGCSQILLSYLQVLVQSVYAYKKVFIINIMVAVVGISFLIIGLPRYGASAYIYTYLLVNGLLCLGYGSTVFIAVKTMKVLPKAKHFELPTTKAIYKTSLYFGVSAILATIVWQRFELSILKEYVDYSELAIYTIAFSVLSLFMEPLKLATGSLLYYFAGIAHHKEQASLTFEKFFKHFSWLVIFIGVFIYFNAEQIVTLIYTYKYVESALYLKILLVGMVPGTCSYVIMNMHVGLGKSRFLLAQDIVCALLFLIGLYIGIQNNGLMGAAWAKSIVILLSVALGLWYTSFRLGFKVPYLSLLKAIALTFLLIAPFQGVLENSILFLFGKGALLFALYFALSWYLHLIDRTLVKDTLNRSKKAFTGLLAR
ncbi:MAG: oligosaccharide flippase family protein [Bacteroidota bacterium]